MDEADSASQPPRTAINAKENRAEKRSWRDWEPTEKFTGVIALFTVIYSLFTVGLWLTTRDQVALLRQQLEATQSAVMTLDVRLAGNVLNLGFNNTGHVIAHFLGGDFVVERKETPDGVDSGPGQRIEIGEQILSPDSSFLRNVFPLHNFAPQELDSIRDNSIGNDTIFISGTFSYDNGFGKRIPVDICKIFVGHARVTRTLETGGTSSIGPLSHFVDCNSYAATVQAFLSAEAERLLQQ